MAALFENASYVVEQLVPARVLSAGNEDEVIVNYAVLNKSTGAEEHQCATLPQAISVAGQLNILLEMAYKGPEELEHDNKGNTIN